MDDQLDEEQDEAYGETDEEIYEWCATGESCAVCDALDGMTFTSAPVVVHPKCDCEVHPRRRGLPSQYTDCENTVKTPAGSTRTDPPENHLTFHVYVEIQCWDGTRITDTVDVDYGDDPQIDVETIGDELWFAVSDHVEELAAINCPQCSPTPIG